jgi:hypothetical protein
MCIMRKVILFIIIVCIVMHCSSSLNRKDEYYFSLERMRHGDLYTARKTIPTTEGESFITIMEYTYLSLLAGNPDIKKLTHYARKIDNQVRFKVSREIKSFFYLETPEGYYASEHEIIWMHLLLSWGYSLQGDFEKARVEAKKSAYLLSSEWSEEGRFDDPLMRIMLASIWTMCGEWEEARVDFRKAAQLQPSLWWAKKLGRLSKPPGQLLIILGGTGPIPYWKPAGKKNFIRGARNIKFSSMARKSNLYFLDADNQYYNLYRSPDSSYWYKRHIIRDNAIQEIIQDSRYMQEMAASGTKAAAKITLGVAGGIIIAAGGIALGGAVAVAGIYLESAEIFVGGLVLGATGAGWGINVAKKTTRKSIKTAKKELDASQKYRFVRYLPEYAWVGWSRKTLPLPVKVYRKKNHARKEILKIEQLADKTEKSNYSYRTSHLNIVIMGFYPDVQAGY